MKFYILIHNVEVVIKQQFCTERFKIKNLNEIEGKEQYQVKILNSFIDLERCKM
jgi:hypothetical protein